MFPMHLHAVYAVYAVSFLMNPMTNELVCCIVKEVTTLQV